MNRFFATLSPLLLLLIPAVTAGAQLAPVLGDPARDPALEPARTALRAGHLPDAEALARAYNEAHPTAAEGRYLLGEILFHENKPQPSLDTFTVAAKLQPPSAFDLRLVALDYVLLKDYDDADHWMTRSVAMNQSDAESWYTLGRIRQTANRFADAVVCFHKSLTLRPRSVLTQDNLGLALQGLNKPDEAIAAYREALAWQAGAAHPSAEPALNLGILLTDRGQLAEARQLLEQAEALAPSEPRVHTALGKLYARLGELPKAQTELEQAATASPTDASLHFQLGQVLRREGKAGESAAELRKAASLEKEHRN